VLDAAYARYKSLDQWLNLEPDRVDADAGAQRLTLAILILAEVVERVIDNLSYRLP